MKSIKFGKFTIGEDSPVLIIAEVACEHKGSMENAKRLIKAVKEAGADIVKFQLHVPEAEMIKGAVKFWAGDMAEVLKEVNFETAEQHKELKEYCEKIGIQYLCTPFCIEASDILSKVGVIGFKTGSGELSNLPMLRHIAKKKKPMIVSTGMSTLQEVADAVKVLKQEKVPFALTHCLSEYPASYENMNLGLIPLYKKKFGVPVGFSDHSTEIIGAIAAVAHGARIIEKHFTIRDLNGPDDLVSLDPEQFKTMVEAIRKTEKAIGTKRFVSKNEQVTRDWAHHSVVTKKALKAGTKLKASDLGPKRPGGGIPSRFLDKNFSKKLIGKTLKRDIPENTLLHWSDLK